MSTTTAPETTTRRQRTTEFAVSAAKGKRITKTRTYTLAEAADLCDVTVHAVRRWVRLGYIESALTPPAEGKGKGHRTVTGEALTTFFAARKQQAKEAQARRVERDAALMARFSSKAEQTEDDGQLEITDAA